MCYTFFMTKEQQIRKAISSHPQTFMETDRETGQIVGVYTIDEGHKIYVARWAIQ